MDFQLLESGESKNSIKMQDKTFKNRRTIKTLQLTRGQQYMPDFAIPGLVERKGIDESQTHVQHHHVQTD